MNTLFEPRADCLEATPVPTVLSSGTPGPPVQPRGLHEDPAKIVENLRVQRDTAIFRLLMSARSAAEFQSLRTELFQKYVYLSGAISNVIKSDLSQQDLDEVLESAYAVLSTVLESDTVLFGGQDEARREALYYLDALHRSQALLNQVVESFAGLKLQEAVEIYNAKPTTETVAYTWFALLHLQAILFAIENHLMPSAEVFKELLAGLRVSTRGYELVREAWGQRFDSTFSELDLSQVQPDSEGEYLVQQSEVEYRHFLESNPSARP